MNPELDPPEAARRMNGQNWESDAAGGQSMSDNKWQYAHVYYDEGGNPHRTRVTKVEFDAHKPDGHMIDGTPYWNYERVCRQVGPWVKCPPQREDNR